MKLKLKPGLLMREVMGEKVLLACMKDHVDFSKLLVLSESAFLLIERMNQDIFVTVDDLTGLLIDRYEVKYEQVKQDVNDLISDLKKLDLLEME